MTAASLLLSTMLVCQRHALTVDSRSPTQIAEMPAVEKPDSSIVQPSARLAVNTTSWPATMSPPAGYLGIRHVALTRGIGILDSDVYETSGRRSSAVDTQRARPVTARDLMNELAPSENSSIHTRP
jgi:hypothetical protein